MLIILFALAFVAGAMYFLFKGKPNLFIFELIENLFDEGEDNK